MSEVNDRIRLLSKVLDVHISIMEIQRGTMDTMSERIDLLVERCDRLNNRIELLEHLTKGKTIICDNLSGKIHEA
jgi:hypothetical protein